MWLRKLFNPRVGVAVTAACAVVAACPGEARAGHEETATFGLLMLSLAHTQLIPAYISTGYYAYASKDPMPPAWTTMNVITGTAAGSVGVAMMALAAEVGDRDHGPRNTNHTEIITGVFGGLTLAAGLTVSVLSIIQATRPEPDEVVVPRGERREQPDKAPEKTDEKVKWSFLVVPSAGVSQGGVPSGSLNLIGTF